MSSEIWYDSWAAAPKTPEGIRAWFRRFEDEARRWRRPGVEGGLRPLDSLQDRRESWAPGPTPRVAPRGHPRYLRLAASTGEFVARLNFDYPELRIPEGGGPWPPADWGLVIAGGAASEAARKSDGRESGDVDFFLVGHPDDSSRRRAVERLGGWLEASPMQEGPLHTHVGPGAITFIASSKRRFQVVLRAYATPAEVLHGFDLGASSVLFDGARVSVNELGAFALETGYNLVGLDGYRLSYEKRLAKYFARGFGLVLPDLDPFALLERRGRLGALQCKKLAPVGDLYRLEAGELTAIGGFAAERSYEDWEANTCPYKRSYGQDENSDGSDAEAERCAEAGLALEGGPPEFRAVDELTLLSPEAGDPEATRRWYGLAFRE